jgi:hypothetical protein
MIKTFIGFLTGLARGLKISGRHRALLGLLVMLLLSSPAGAGAAGKTNQAPLGEVTVSLAGPAGLARVDGLNAQVDDYIQKTAPKLKFQVLALYAVADEWAAFVAAAAAGRPASLPRFALLGTTQNMPKKHYDNKNLRRELTRYERWFGLGADNRPLAAVLTRQGNRKLTEVMGVDIGFKFQVDQFTRKFDQGGDFLSVGAKVAFNIFGQPSQAFLTVTALAVGDKIVYLAYFEKDKEIQSIQEQARAWRQNMSRLNAAQYKP